MDFTHFMCEHVPKFCVAKVENVKCGTEIRNEM